MTGDRRLPRTVHRGGGSGVEASTTSRGCVVCRAAAFMSLGSPVVPFTSFLVLGL